MISYPLAWNLVQTRTLLGHSGAISVLTVAGELLFSGGVDRTIRIWHWGSGELRHCLQGHSGPIRGLGVIRQQERELLVSGCCYGEIRFWDPTTGEGLGQLTTDLGSLQALAVSPDTSRLVLAGGAEPVLQVWDLQSCQLYLKLYGHVDRIHALSLSQGGVFLASVSDDETVWVWDLVAGESICRIPSIGPLNAVAFTSNGQQLAGGGVDYTLKRWDPFTGKLLAVHPEHNNWIRAVATDPTGRWLATGGDDYSIWLHQLPRCIAVRVYRDPAACISALTFSNDGRTLISGNRAGDIRLWSVNST
ncbi:MAG: WD40 repeat domain-containing protein [Thermostichus sp. DG02_3_bins_51]